jgi:ABC-type sugar transport system substrate-binding protein
MARYRWYVLAGAGVLATALLAAAVWWWLRPESGQEPRARVYREFDICVLMPGDGLADPEAAAVWAGVQEVSLAQRVRALYLPVAGEQTPERAAQFLATLVTQECEIIVAVGGAPVAAVATNEAKHAGTTIVAVGDEIENSSHERITSSTVDVLTELVPPA